MKTEKLENYINSHDYNIPLSVCLPYKYIWAWNVQDGSMNYYIANRVKQALEDNAPLNATYYDSTTKIWHTIDEAHPITQSRLKRYLNDTTRAKL